MKNGNRKNSIVIIIVFAIAMNFAGCTTETDTKPVYENGTVTDIENNVYRTVKIGNQWWMAENLNVKKFRNGNLIMKAQSDADWSSAASAYCQYDNNAASPGLLYNHAAITDTNNIAPVGWHVATDEDWKVLETTLGMSKSEADQAGWRGYETANYLRIESPQGWTRFGNVWSTNESGFSALAGGCRLPDGTWADPGLFATGFWWSASDHDSIEAFYRYMDYKKTSVFRSHTNKKYGMSVRCVKD